MICGNCGTEIQDGVKFYSECGTKQEKSVSKTTNFSISDRKNKTIRVGKNQEIKTLKQALEVINDNGTIILEFGIYNEHINFDKEVKLVGATDSIMEKSSDELPIIVLDSTKTCKITANVEIEGVVFTHKENISFDNLQNYADIKYEFDDDKEFTKLDTDGYTAIEISSRAILKNVALLDSQNIGLVYSKESGILENSLVAHSYWNNIFCKNNSSPRITNLKLINSNGINLLLSDFANPSVKNCEINNSVEIGIAVTGQASGTFEECHIHNVGENCLSVDGNATPKFINCKIHDNTEFALVELCDTSNPTLTNCEIYNGGGISIIVEDQASGTFEGCNIYNIGDNNGLNIYGNATPKFTKCKIHHNTEYALVYVGERSNPALIDCEIYNGANYGIVVEDQACGTYENCYLYDNEGENFCNESSNSIDTSTCKME